MAAQAYSEYDAEIKIGMRCRAQVQPHGNVGKAMSTYFDKMENRCTIFRIMR
jgi:hypothetical protein